MIIMKYYIKDIKKIKIHNIQNKNGIISVLEKIDIPQIKFNRIFFVKNTKKTIRGNHAHKKCYQLIFSLFGKIVLICDDGLKRKKITLKPVEDSYLIPPTIWTKQEYNQKNSILGVICNEIYDEKDYIRNYEKFKKYYKL